MGRPKIPTNIVKLTGNPGRRKLNGSEPQPPPGVPKKPSWIGKEASAEWDRIVPQLVACGLLTHLDYAALLGYCTSYEHWVKAEAEIREHGTVLTTPNGMLQRSPYLTQANQSLKLMRQFVSDFGLSPASRSKVTVGGQQKEDDPLAKYRA